jgi:hypothetical protein
VDVRDFLELRASHPRWSLGPSTLRKLVYQPAPASWVQVGGIESEGDSAGGPDRVVGPVHRFSVNVTLTGGLDELWTYAEMAVGVSGL